jgi:hypothetical protein
MQQQDVLNKDQTKGGCMSHVTSGMVLQFGKSKSDLSGSNNDENRIARQI